MISNDDPNYIPHRNVMVDFIEADIENSYETSKSQQINHVFYKK